VVATAASGVLGFWAFVQGFLRFAVPSDPCLDRACEHSDAVFVWSGVVALVLALAMSVWASLELIRRHDQVFVAPPGWPPAPVGWRPFRGWLPDPRWPPAPPGWVFWRRPGSAASASESLRWRE
jgi:hypothetical protein